MKASMYLQNPKKIEATMTITMTVEEWERLETQLNDGYPSWEFAGHIRSLLAQTNKVVSEEHNLTPAEE